MIEENTKKKEKELVELVMKSGYKVYEIKKKKEELKEEEKNLEMTIE
jgi:hypothetical protein